MKDFTDIPGYENRYAINKKGQVWSYPRTWLAGTLRTSSLSHKGKFLTPYKVSQYFGVSMSEEDGTKVKRYIHRLLAITYLSNTENFRYINHKDGNKLNNALENIEWCTQSDNMKHAYATGLHHGRAGNYRKAVN